MRRKHEVGRWANKRRQGFRSPSSPPSEDGKLRLTYIHQHFKRPDQAGGSRPFEHARRLAAIGYDVRVIAGGDRDRRYRIAGFTVEEIAATYKNSFSLPRRVLSFLAFSGKATVRVVTTSSDLVIASSTPLTVAVPALAARLIRRTPYIFEVRDLWPGVPIELGLIQSRAARWAARMLERAAYRHAEHVIALSPGMADGVAAVDPSVPITVVPNASDLERFSQPSPGRRVSRGDLGWKADDRVAVYVGSFGKSYRLEYLLEIAARLERPCRLVMVGEGASTPGLLERARHLGLNTDEILVGSKPKEEAAAYVIAADVVVSSLENVPALHVNSLNKVFDGLAAGKPLAFTHDGWLSDLCQDAGAGVRIDPEDPDIAAHQLAALMLDESRLEEMGRAADYLARRRFHRDRVFADFRTVIESLQRSRRV